MFRIVNTQKGNCIEAGTYLVGKSGAVLKTFSDMVLVDLLSVQADQEQGYRFVSLIKYDLEDRKNLMEGKPSFYKGKEEAQFVGVLRRLYNMGIRYNSAVANAISSQLNRLPQSDDVKKLSEWNAKLITQKDCDLSK